MMVQGDMVHDLYAAGKLSEINEYCRCDVLDTYFVFLRVALLMGQITLEREQELVKQTKVMLEADVKRHPAYAQYLEQWGDWQNPWAQH